MSRILTVATSEFMSLVRTKFFIIGILMMPVIVGASIAFQVFAAKHVDIEDHKVAIIDHTGALYAALAKAADKHNADMGSGADQKGPHFLPSEVDLGGRSIDDVKLELSAEVKAKKLFAFVEIPAGIADLDASPKAVVEYHTETPSYDALPDWLDSVLNHEISIRRFAQASVDVALIPKLTRDVKISTMSLVERSATGAVEAKAVDQIETFVLPFAMMYLLFLSVLSSAPQLLNAVIEEKMSKISEVLVASVTPFQLMMGKLIGMQLVAVVLATVYLVGGSYALLYSGRWEVLQPALFGWFFVFLICAALIFGSLFLSIGAASSDIKDAQGMMQPAMILVMLPVLMAPVILRAPDSTFAIGASLFPPATPFLMLIRLAMKPGPPLWQLALGVALTIGTAMLFVWAAGRIFRVGLLMQGKGATLAEMLRWIRA